MTSELQRILVTVTGPDTPGITAELTGVIATNQVALLDIEQVVVQGQLTLCLLLGVDPRPGHGDPVLKDLLFTAKGMGLDLSFKALAAPAFTGDVQQFAVTAIGDDLDAAGVRTVAQVLADHRVNIERIGRLSDGNLASVEFLIAMPVSADAATAHAQAKDLRRTLIEATTDLRIDIAVQRETLTRRSKRLVVMDMDSTLIQMEVIDELARIRGVGDQVAELTRRAMAGELDFEQSLRARVGLLEGLDAGALADLVRRLPITPGARELLAVLRTLGYRTAVISGGFSFAANALKEQLGLDYAYSNQLEVRGGHLTGRVVDPVVTPMRKADLLDLIAQGEGIALEQTIAIGDGANDLPMLERAGLGIAFHAKPKLRAAADTAVSAGGLDRILYLLGLRTRDINEVLGRS